MVFFKRVAPGYEPGHKEITNKLQILNHCSKDFQCRIVAFMLNIRQWYYILRRDSKFLLACVLLSPSVNEEVFSQQFTHHNKYSSTSFKQRLPAVFDGNNTFNNIIFPRCSRSWPYRWSRFDSLLSCFCLCCILFSFCFGF